MKDKDISIASLTLAAYLYCLKCVANREGVGDSYSPNDRLHLEMTELAFNALQASIKRSDDLERQLAHARTRADVRDSE